MRTTKNLNLAMAFAIGILFAGCGEDQQMEPAAPQTNTVQVVTDTTDLCDSKLQACTTLVARGIDACSNRAYLTANQQCVGESVQCVNDALTASNACAEAEDLCRIQGSPEIRACTRTCRDTYTTAQAVCTSSQSLALDACGRRLSSANERCREQGAQAYQPCIAQTEAGRTRCEGDVRLTYNMCLDGLDNIETACRMECAPNSTTCQDGCSEAHERSRIRCETEERLGLDACQGDFNALEAVCRVQERTVREACESMIPADIRTCSDDAFRNTQLCQQRAGDQQEDCARACDPSGNQRCNMHCSDRFYASYGECIQSDWSCFTRRSNEGGLMCEEQGAVKIDECFTEAEACKAKL